MPMLVPDAVNQRWSMDFVSDQIANGRRFRALNIVDDYSRECIHQIIATSISGFRVARELERTNRPLPNTIVRDNGLEFTSGAMFFWAQEHRLKLHLIQPVKPTQNAFVESFNGKFREYCLYLNWLMSLEDTVSTIHDWRDHYSIVRPHRSLDNIPPKLFAKQVA
jgi:putative transposase